MTGEDPRDFLKMLLAEGVISKDEAKVLHHEVGFCERDRARISALVTILKHRHPDVSDKQIEIEATALHLAHLAVTAVGGERETLEIYATLVAHVVRNAMIIAEEEGGRSMRDAFLDICKPLLERLCNEGADAETVSVN